MFLSLFIGSFIHLIPGDLEATDLLCAVTPELATPQEVAGDDIAQITGQFNDPATYTSTCNMSESIGIRWCWSDEVPTQCWDCFTGAGKWDLNECMSKAMDYMKGHKPTQVGDNYKPINPVQEVKGCHQRKNSCRQTNNCTWNVFHGRDGWNPSEDPESRAACVPGLTRERGPVDGKSQIVKVCFGCQSRGCTTLRMQCICEERLP